MIRLTPADGLPKLTVEFGEPPTGAEAEAIRAQQERARRNSQWLQTDWQQLLPQVRGKFVAVAGEEGFITDTAEDAWAWARRAHSEDDGAMVQYVRTDTNPRICLQRTFRARAKRGQPP